MRNVIKLVTLLLCAAMLAGPIGCVRQEEIISGGTTDKTDPNAPKVIVSKDITELDTTFYLHNRWSGEDDHLFRFVIRENEDGVRTAYETERDISRPADEALLNGIQTIIDETQLVSKNGYNRVTAGLPPEFFVYSTTVRYASGEELYFRMNNDPDAEWAAALYDLFAAWFAAQGETALDPMMERGTVSEVRLSILESGILHEYEPITVAEADAIDGQTFLLCRTILGEDTSETQYAAYPTDFSERLTAMIAETNLLRQYEFTYNEHIDGYFGFGSHADDEPDAEDSLFELQLTFSDDGRIDIETRKASEIAAAQPLIDSIRTYLDSFFD